jgi:hypothetical protein
LLNLILQSTIIRKMTRQQIGQWQAYLKRSETLAMALRDHGLATRMRMTMSKSYRKRKKWNRMKNRSRASSGPTTS